MKTNIKTTLPCLAFLLTGIFVTTNSYATAVDISLTVKPPKEGVVCTHKNISISKHYKDVSDQIQYNNSFLYGSDNLFPGDISITVSISCPGTTPFTVRAYKDSSGGLHHEIINGSVAHSQTNNNTIEFKPVNFGFVLNDDFDGFEGTGKFNYIPFPDGSPIPSSYYQCEMIPFPGGAAIKGGAKCKITEIDSKHHIINYSLPTEGTYPQYYIHFTAKGDGFSYDRTQLIEQTSNWRVNYLGREDDSIFGTILHGSEPFKFQCYIKDDSGKEDDSRCTVSENTYVTATVKSAEEHVMVYKDNDKDQAKEMKIPD